MPKLDLRSLALRIALAVVLLGSAWGLLGCDKDTDTGTDSPGEPASEPVADEGQERPEGYSSWVINVVGDDSYTEGDITYTIAMNLTATNPTQSIAGAYSGSATAVTTTTGTVEGLPLNASATVNSTKLEFTLVDEAGSDALAPLTAEEAVCSGTGTIVMAAAGSGTVGPAGGGFSNTSGQQVQVRTEGLAVTFSVDISGHTYTFEGTLQGQ